MEWVRVSPDSRGFVLEPSEKPFRPWGFNYDHDETEKGRLIEDYWVGEWGKVEQDFGEMKELGANIVRIHLQYGKFMDAPDRPNAVSLDQLGRLVKLCEELGLYLDLTGLGCYHKKDVPPWYDALSENDRWTAQEKFWEAIAQRCASSPAIFCYDLMNEPVVSGGPAKKDWLGPPFGTGEGAKHFVQYISLDPVERPRPQVARVWIGRLVAAIRRHDKRHLVTVGLVDWSLDRPGLTSGFVPQKIATELDFIAVHLYPKGGKLDEALATLRGFNVGKPVVVEETFPLGCTADELGRFMDMAGGHAAGWIGFYWGKTPQELKAGGTIGEAMTLAWLELFHKKATAMTGQR